MGSPDFGNNDPVSSQAWPLDFPPTVNVDFTMMADMNSPKAVNFNHEWDICPDYSPPQPSLLPQRQLSQGFSATVGPDKQSALDFILA
jgi:hypothetical protein